MYNLGANLISKTILGAKMVGCHLSYDWGSAITSLTRFLNLCIMFYLVVLAEFAPIKHAF